MQPQRAREADVSSLAQQRSQLVHGERRLQLPLLGIRDPRGRRKMRRHPPRTVPGVMAAPLLKSTAPVTTAALALALTSFPGLAAADPAPVRYPAGATAFQANCAVCHGAKGAGTPSLAPPVTSYPARYAANADGRKQLAMTVLNGMFGGIEVEQKHFDFKMPEFIQLDDATLP